MTQPDVWLRGPVADVPALLQPAAHALLQAAEDVERVVAEMGPGDLWRRPGGAASAGFHFKHLIGATERLLGYGRGDQISDSERAWLGLESRDGEPAVTAQALAERFRKVVEAAIAEFRSVPMERLTEPRAIGRLGLPTTVMGCIFHAAEHATRHAGQLITTVKALD